MSRFFKDIKQRSRTLGAVAFRVLGLLHNIVSFQPFHCALRRSDRK
jgi:hypothetical protein